MVAELTTINIHKFKETYLMRLASVYHCVAFTVNPDMCTYCILNIQSLQARFPNPPFMPKSLRRDQDEQAAHIFFVFP